MKIRIEVSVLDDEEKFLNKEACTLGPRLVGELLKAGPATGEQARFLRDEVAATADKLMLTAIRRHEEEDGG